MAQPHKPGWQTTEFWTTFLTVAGGVAAVVAGLPLGAVALVGSGVAAGGYAIARGITKAKQGDAAGAARDIAEGAAAVGAAARKL